ncbi:MAG: hypothetical protein J6Z49_05035 [Kiritimatiellae bacterium]|nr:hypothetical protein [Kiritimatiellia bacterium]
MFFFRTAGLWAFISALMMVGTPSLAGDGFSLQREEFTRYYRQITGKDASADVVCFAIDPKVSKSGRDAYRIVSCGGNAQAAHCTGRTGCQPVQVTITGSNMRSVWYGLYDLLERRGGCRWFWDGDVVSKRDSIDLSDLDIYEEAHFEYRAIRYFAHRGLTRFQAEHWGPEDWKREIDWILKKRLNVFMLRIGQDDLFQRTYPEACKYPDPSKRLPGAGSSYNDRTLFWSLQYRGELRRKIQKYGFERGLLAPEDFGTMTHWYSRTPEDWLANKKPQFLPQASGSAAGRNGLVWDIRDDKWVDAYWKLTTTAVEQYGAGAPKPQLLHTIGLSERSCYKERKKNFDLKIEALDKFFARAKRDYPDAKLLLSGWDFYGGWKAEDVRAFLPKLDKQRVILWDYEADCQEKRDTFVDWDVIGKFPYTYSTILAFEAALDARADYPFIEKRQRLVQDDPMCVGWIHWPESAHTDTLFLDFFTANAWADKPIPHGEVLDAFCKGRYGKNAALLKSVWVDVLDASALRRWDEYSESNLNCAQHLIYHGILKKDYEKRPAQWGPPVAKAMSALRRLEDVPWDDAFIRRDAIDMVRLVLDRLIVIRIDELGTAVTKWRDEKCKAADEELVARAHNLTALFNLLADVLELHTDYSLWESYLRLDAIEKVRNPDFTKTLFENAVNQYCLSHQYEAIRYVVAPTMAELSERMARAVESGDRRAGFPARPGFEKIRKDAKSKPLESLKPVMPRTKENFIKVLREIERLYSQPMRDAAECVTKAEYLDLVEAAVSAYSDEHVRAYIAEVEQNGVQEHGFPRLTANLGGLIAAGRQRKRTEVFRQMMDISCRNARKGMMKKSGGGNEFSVKELVGAILDLERAGVFPKEVTDAWRRDISEVDPWRCYRAKPKAGDQVRSYNWAVFGAASEQTRINAGMGGNPRFVERYVSDQMRWFDGNGMWRDPHEPLVYDFVTRLQFAQILFAGYDGPSRTLLLDHLGRGAEAVLALQSAAGEIPYGGRSNQFLHNDTFYAALCEWYAVWFRKRGDLATAARFRAAAAKAVAGTRRWLAERPVRHVKNLYAPGSGKPGTGIGCEDYAYFDKYMATMGSWAMMAVRFLDDTPLPKAPKPEEVSAFASSPYFHIVTLRAGDYSAQFDYNADPHYDCDGLGRIHRRDAPTAICLSVPCARKPSYHTERPNGRALAIAPVGGGKLTPAGSGHDKDYAWANWRQGALDWRCRLTKDGLVSELRGDGEVALSLPAFAFDGKNKTTISCEGGTLVIRYRGWRCRYQTDGTIVDTGVSCCNRNGRYRVFEARGNERLSVKVSIVDLSK